MTGLPQALLTYAVTPTAVPEGETVTLQLSVTNASGAYVPCEQIVFSLPVGTKGGALTNDPGSIAAAPVAGTNWSISGDGAGNFTATPNAPVTGLGKDASIAFVLTGLEVSDAVGLAAIDVLETSGTPLTGRAPQPPPTVDKTKPGLAITSFTASPVAVCPGAQVTLAWTTTGAEHCTISWPGAGYTVDKNETAYPVNPEVATIYTLTAVGEGHTVHDYIPVAVTSPQIVTFGAKPTDVGALGGSSTLTWLVIDADTCTIEPEVGTVDANGGAVSVTPTQPTLYTLEATGCGDTVSEGAYVNVDAVQIQSFAPSAAQIYCGDSSALEWTTAAATSVSIDQGVGAVPTSGSQSVTPQQTTTYTLSAAGYEPKQATAEVQVTPVITSLTLDVASESIYFEQVTVVTLTWATSGASGVTIAGASYGASGSVQFQNPDVPTTWAFAAQGVGTEATASLSLNSLQIGEMSGLEVQVALQAAGSSVNAPGESVNVTLGGDGAGWFSGLVTDNTGGEYGVQQGPGTFVFPTGGGQWGGDVTGSGNGSSIELVWTIP